MFDSVLVGSLVVILLFAGIFIFLFDVHFVNSLVYISFSFVECQRELKHDVLRRE